MQTCFPWLRSTKRGKRAHPVTHHLQIMFGDHLGNRVTKACLLVEYFGRHRVVDPKFENAVAVRAHQFQTRQVQ
jgi:hypothetical protein